MIDDIKVLIESRNALAQQAYLQYEPSANNIIASQNKDVNHICYTMDCMLDFCFDEQMLLLYRRLCRYLYDIDQGAAADYVNAYREMWDEEGNQFGNNKYMNGDSADSSINQGNPVIIPIKVQTIVSENFKTVAI